MTRRITQRFDVLIVNSSTRIVESITGIDLRADAADKREQSTLLQVNIGPYFVTQAEAGKFKRGDTFTI